MLTKILLNKRRNSYPKYELKCYCYNDINNIYNLIFQLENRIKELEQIINDKENIINISPLTSDMSADAYNLQDFNRHMNKINNSMSFDNLE